MLVTRVTVMLFFLTYLLVIGLDFLLKNLNFQHVLRDLFDTQHNPGNIYSYLMIAVALIYSFIADYRIKKGHIFKKRTSK